MASTSAASAVLILALRLLDPRSGNVLSPAAVLVENGKIKEVGAPSQVQAAAPAGVKIIDLGSAMLLPGLIDGHTHLFLDMVVLPEVEQDRHSNGLFGSGTVAGHRRVAEQARFARRTNGERRPGERDHHRSQSWPFRN
jgi:imidazolonepropionase-like amidohydrolase